MPCHLHYWMFLAGQNYLINFTSMCGGLPRVRWSLLLAGELRAPAVLGYLLVYFFHHQLFARVPRNVLGTLIALVVLLTLLCRLCCDGTTAARGKLPSRAWEAPGAFATTRGISPLAFDAQPSFRHRPIAPGSGQVLKHIQEQPLF